MNPGHESEQNYLKKNINMEKQITLTLEDARKMYFGSNDKAVKEKMLTIFSKEELDGRLDRVMAVIKGNNYFNSEKNNVEIPEIFIKLIRDAYNLGLEDAAEKTKCFVVGPDTPGFNETTHFNFDFSGICIGNNKYRIDTPQFSEEISKLKLP